LENDINSYTQVVEKEKNGVSIILNEELKQQVVDVSRESDRLMRVRIIWGRSILHISGYAPPKLDAQNKTRRNSENIWKT